MPANSTVDRRGTIARLQGAWRTLNPHMRRRLVSLYAVLIGFNVIVWGAVFVASSRFSLLLGLAPIAYGFGLRHAVDPDHIAAIDNTTRKLMRDGKRPLTVGLFFSLGHSTIVFLLSVLIAVSAVFVQRTLPQMQMVGGVIGTSVSGFFLLIIAAINLIVFFDIWSTWRTMRREGTVDQQALDEGLIGGGLFSHLLRPLFRLVSSSWHMYPIGLLFGLGFDTASEIGILGMSASAGAGGMPVWLILLLPLLFVAGMTLVDTTDGIAMMGAYGWAYIRPVRKLYYNLNITLISVLVALFIGALELLQVIGSETGATGGIWAWAAGVPFSMLGWYIIGILGASWVISVLVYKLRGIGRLDDELSVAMARPQE